MSLRPVLAAGIALALLSRGAVAHAQADTEGARTPEREAWLRDRCAQLVAYYDRYAVGRGENSDGPRNHTRIAAAIECSRGNYEVGIRTMTTLLKNKRFDIIAPGTPALEPEDIGAPDIVNPTRRWRGATRPRSRR